MTNKIFTKNGTEYINSLIKSALSNGKNEATVEGNYEIAEEIRLPSNFTLYLKNAHLIMADGVYSNMFVNEHHCTEIGKTPEGRDRNIKIIGDGSSILDGGKYNGLSEKNQNKDGLPPIWKNNLILFINTEGIEISGIKCQNQRWWALDFIYCANGVLRNIDFCSCDIWVDDDGVEHHGLHNVDYGKILVKNSDGIDLRVGCHDFLIENITGFTEDDTVALTNLNGFEKQFGIENLPTDIANVTIRHIHASAFCSIVRLLNQGEEKLHDITIEDVVDTSADSPNMDRGICAVRVGDAYAMYGSRHSTAEETYNITIDRVKSRAGNALQLAGEIGNLKYDNITAFDNGGGVLDLR